MINILDNTTPLVRSAICEFISECYKWIRGGVKQYIENNIYNV